MSDFFAESGYWSDIVAAIVQAKIGDNIHIPPGKYNFVDPGEVWMGDRVVVPEGLSLFGAPSKIDAYGNVISWSTQIFLPWDVPGSWINIPNWFALRGNHTPGLFTRISDIKMTGYRSIDPASTTLHRGIYVDKVQNFRVDHMCLEHTAGGGVSTWGFNTCGVIDHNNIYNIYGVTNLVNYALGNVGYGVSNGRDYFAHGLGYEPLGNVLGQYTDHSIFIENNFISRWRHCTSPGHGAHQVVRYNLFDQDFDTFTLDVHGLRDSGADRWGTRLCEIYENTLINKIGNSYPPTDPPSEGGLAQLEGGSGVWFNNFVDSSYDGFHGGVAVMEQCTLPGTTWDLRNFYFWSAKGPHSFETDPWPWYSPSGVSWDEALRQERHVLSDWSRDAGIPADPNYPNVNPIWPIANYKPYKHPHPFVLGIPLRKLSINASISGVPFNVRRLG